MMTRTYRILTSTTVDGLEAKVMDLKRKGWTTAGGVNADMIGGIAQAMNGPELSEPDSTKVPSGEDLLKLLDDPPTANCIKRAITNPHKRFMPPYLGPLQTISDLTIEHLNELVIGGMYVQDIGPKRRELILRVLEKEGLLTP